MSKICRCFFLIVHVIIFIRKSMPFFWDYCFGLAIKTIPQKEHTFFVFLLNNFRYGLAIAERFRSSCVYELTMNLIKGSCGSTGVILGFSDSMNARTVPLFLHYINERGQDGAITIDEI